MPYIRGRYYMNPVVGDALEAAREAEAALQALEHAAKVARGDTGKNDDASAGSSSASGSGANSNADAYAKSAPGPIHRVEIEALRSRPRTFRTSPARLRSPHPSPRQRQRRKRGRASFIPRSLKFAVVVNRKLKRERIRLAIRAQFLEARYNAPRRSPPRPRNPRLLQSQRPDEFPPRPIRRRLQVAPPDQQRRRRGTEFAWIAHGTAPRRAL